MKKFLSITIILFVAIVLGLGSFGFADAQGNYECYWDPFVSPKCQTTNRCDTHPDDDKYYIPNYAACNRQGDPDRCENTAGRCTLQFIGSTTPTQPGTSDGSLRLQNPLTAQTFEELVGRIITFLIIIAAPLLVLMILIAAFIYMTGGANPEKRKKAGNIIKYGIIGFVIIILAWAIVAIVRMVF